MTTIGVLGLGSIGLRHARNLVVLGCDVIAHDPDPERRRLWEDAGGRCAASRAGLMSSVAGVVVASPNRFHLDDLSEAVAKRLPALVEKPLAVTSQGVAAVVEAAEASGVPIFAALNLRFHPAVRAVRELVEDGSLGAPVWARFQFSAWLPDWRPHQDHRQGYCADPVTGGVLFDDIHEFDLAWHLLGEARCSAAVAASTGIIGIPSDDRADAILSHRSGAVTTIHCDYVTRPRVRQFQLALTGGLVSVDLDARHLIVRQASGAVTRDEAFPGSYADDYVDEMKSFLACVVDGAAPACDGREALAVLRLVEQARTLSGLPHP